jgi:hypothetical protein
MKGQRRMAELDLQEATRRDDIYNELVIITDKITKLPVFPSLLWVWTFDIIKDIFDNHQYDEAAENDYEVIPQGVTLKQIFDKFWEDVDTLGFSMDQGDEILNESIRDWMSENDFLVNPDDEEEDEDE